MTHFAWQQFEREAGNGSGDDIVDRERDSNRDLDRLREQLRSAQEELERHRAVESALRESSVEQRRRCDKALFASEARFHHLVDAITDYAICSLDAGGHVVTWNAGAARIKGYDGDEIIGCHFSIFYTSEARAAGKPEQILETLRRDGRFEDEGWRVRKDGSRFWANVVMTALRDDSGEIAGFAKVTRDLTARRDADANERALAREQAARAASEKVAADLAHLNRVSALFIADPSRLEAILAEIVDAAIAVAGADLGNIQLLDVDATRLRICAQRGFSDEWVAFWNGFTAGEGACGTALARRERVIVEDVEASPIFAGRPSLEVQREAGVRAIVSIPVVSRTGNSLGMLSTHHHEPHCPDEATLRTLELLACHAADIIERARAVAAAAAIREELERANRAKDEFLSTMSHELRTPLNSVLGWLTMLRRDSADPVMLARGLEVIERNARTQARLVEDLLDVSRIIGGKLRLKLKSIAPMDAIVAAADVVGPAADAKGVSLDLDLDAELTKMVADPDRLQQIVWNLLSNAVRFTPSGGRVTVTARREDGALAIRVRDTGSGIPAEHLPYIFERFRQVDSSTTRAHGGLGLGLAIVRHLVEAHGGSVAATSDGVGLGAVFTVVLPIPAVNVSSEHVAAVTRGVEPNALGRSVQPDLSGLGVLVVDDDEDSRELVRVVLESVGAEVTTAANGADALDLAARFDVIVSDIAMPAMDGYAFMRAVRSRDVGATTPAIALTAHGGRGAGDRAARAGYQEHLVKPVDLSALLEAVGRWARRKR